MTLLETESKIIVGGEGPLDAKIAIVGEALGENEERERRPFVGMAGSLLNKILASVGILRSSCYITNVIKERPIGNNIKQFIDLSKKYPTMTEEYKEYEQKLYDELSICKANVIMVTGNVPLYALTRKRGILRQRGSILNGVSEIDGRKVIPVIHPSAALRMYIYRHFIKHDMERVLEESSHPGINRTKRDLVIGPQFTDVMTSLTNIATCHKTAFDIEVSNEEVSCISFAPDPYNAISVPFTRGIDDYFGLDNEMDIWSAIAYILENENIKKIGQNIIFDSSFLFRRYGIRVKNMEDTMVAHGLLFPEYPKGLDFLTSIYTTEPYYKDAGKHRLKGMTSDDRGFWTYNAKDSAVLPEILPKVKKDLAEINNTEAYEFQMKLIEPLVYMSEHGFRVDGEGLSKASKEAGERIVNMQTQLNDMCLQEVNTNSNTQLKQYFYITKGLSPYYKRTPGQSKSTVTVDENALKRIARKGYPEASLILDIRRLRKLKSTYLDIGLSSDGRLRCSYNPVGTTSGRLSSSKTIFGEGGNMQNQPLEMLQFLIPDDGYVFYTLDLSNAENRIVAYTAPEPNMIEAFEKGLDIHSHTASLMLDKPYDEISDEPGSSGLGDGRHSERFWAKKSNHAFNYDMGHKTFALMCEMPENQGQMLHLLYHKMYPGVRNQYHNWVRNSLSQTRSLTDCFGKTRLFMDRWSDSLFKEAYSFIPQSTVARQINEKGLCYIYYDPIQSHAILPHILPNFKSVELLNQVHDSIVCQIPINIGWDTHSSILKSVKRSLEQSITWKGTSFNIPCEIKMGMNLKDMKKVDANSNSLRRTYEN